MSVIDPSLGRRIKELRESLGEGQTAFGARFGVEQPTISRWEVGNVPKRTLWAKIARVADISQADFFFGVPDPDEARAANGRRPLVPSFDPDAAESPIDPDAAPNSSNFPPDAIKELASKAGMGAGQTIATTYVRDGQEIVQRDAVRDDYWRIPPDFVQSLLHARTIDLLVVECDGDSMAPTLMPKERVIVNTAHRKISPDGLYAYRNQYEDVVIKRLELFGTAPPRVRIISDNPKHEPQERGLDEIEVVGKVVLGLKLF